MEVNILTLFPEMFKPFMGESIMAKAIEKGLFNINITNIRDFSENKHKKVDDYPFGGGAGMLMSAQPIFSTLEHLGVSREEGIIYMSPRGKKLDMETTYRLSERKKMTILCGHYEGVDQRVLDYWNAEEISIGDYVLTGGELPAMVLLDTVSRLVPGVLSSDNSAHEESIYSGLLEYPQYTKPRKFKGLRVPEVLVNGNHKLIELWKYEKALEITAERRPDIFEKYLTFIEEDLAEKKELSLYEKQLLKEKMNVLKNVEKYYEKV